jgi:hypothetical protein
MDCLEPNGIEDWMVGFSDDNAIPTPKLAHYYKMFVRLAYQVRPDLGVDSQN